jgi:hypothetical protein
MINSLQLIVYIPLFNIIFPAKLNALLSILISAATFDIVPMIDEINNSVFGFNHTNEEVVMNSIGYEQLGFETKNFTRNTGSMFLIAILFVLRIIVEKALLIFIGYKETAFCIRSLRKIRIQKQVHQIIIWFLIEGYIELLISAILSFELFSKYDRIFSNLSDAFCFIISIVFLIILIGLPLFTIIKIRQKYSILNEIKDMADDTDRNIIEELELKNKKLDIYYGVLFHGLRQKESSFLQLSYYYFYTSRRFIFVILAYYFDS